MLDKLISGLKDRNHKCIAKVISLIENDDPLGKEIIQLIPYKGNNSHRIGITGPPGAGKSTITNKLIKNFQSSNQTVCALLIDPSSPFSNGAILGDRIRMDNYIDDNVFIRSLATRGSKGGLSKNIDDIVNVLEFCGFDSIILETVGVGQVEIDIVEIAETVVLVLVPESGDDIQIMKAGLIEIADIFVINKSDREESDKIHLSIDNMLKISEIDGWYPSIVKTVAIKDIGISKLSKYIFRHLKYLNESNILRKKIDDRYERNIKKILRLDFDKNFWTSKRLKYIEKEMQKKISLRKNAHELTKALKEI